MTSQQKLDSRLEERSESFKKDAGSAKALKLSKAKVEAEAWESDPWRDNHFKGMREEMQRREAARREQQRTTEVTLTFKMEVSSPLKRKKARGRQREILFLPRKGKGAWVYK